MAATSTTVMKTIVLVTGANRGIGHEISTSLLRSPSQPPGGSGAPYHVIMCSRSAEKGAAALKEATAQLPADSPNSAESLVLDVTDAGSISAAAAHVRSTLGRVDVLVNNAGIVVRTEDNVARLRETLETNLLGPYAVTDAFRSLVLAQPPSPSATDAAAVGRKDKRVAYVTSGLGSMGLLAQPDHPHRSLPAHEYRISKAGINMLTLCQSIALEKQGVKVFAWDPGFCITGLTGEADKERRRRQGGNDPAVVAETFVHIVDGRADAFAGQVLDERLNVSPW